MDEFVGSRLLQQGSRPEWRTSSWLCKKQISVEMARRGQTDIDSCGRRDNLGARSCATASSQTSLLLVRHLSPEIRHVVSLCRDPCTRNLWTHYPPPPHRTSDYSPDTYPLAANHRPSRHCSNPTNKNGVFHVKHAVRFPPTAATIKPSSSPTRGTFRSRADSAQVRPPALPAQTRPSPAHNRSRRSATRPWRSARSAALQRPYRATH